MKLTNAQLLAANMALRNIKETEKVEGKLSAYLVKMKEHIQEKLNAHHKEQS